MYVSFLLYDRTPNKMLEMHTNIENDTTTTAAGLHSTDF